MKKHQKVIAITVIGLAVATVVSVIFYGFLAPAHQNILLFYLIVISAWTSFAGVAWALYLVWVYELSVHKAKEEIDKRLGGGFAGGLASVLERAQKRFNELTPEQRERILKLADKTINMFFEKLRKFEEAPPAPPRVLPSVPQLPKSDAKHKQQEVEK